MSEIPVPSEENSSREIETREEYKEAVKAYLADAPFGSPRIKVVDDVARDFRADSMPNPEDPHDQTFINLRKAAVQDRIRDHETSIPGYRNALTEFRTASGEYLPDKIFDIEYNLAWEKEGADSNGKDYDEGSEGAKRLTGMTGRFASHILTELVNERLDQTKEGSSTTA